MAEAPHGLRFFKFLLPDFSIKLKLPFEFIELDNKGARRETATLMSPNGSTWDVDIYRGSNNQLYLGGENWINFTVVNKLGVSKLLVFHYRGNMVFCFRAFGLCTKEILYFSATDQCVGHDNSSEEMKGLRFFRFLLPDFSTKLMLPSNFTDPNIKNTRRETATLLSPNGTIWTVRLVREPNELYLEGERWRDFTLANKLGVGYLLVFHHKENMVFSLRAFDSSTKEISYSSSSAQKGQKGKEKIISDHAAHHDAVVEPPQARCVKRERDEDQDDSVRQSHSTEKVGFEVMIEASNCCPEIPAESTLYSLLKEREEATIIDRQGHTWTIGLLHCTKSHTVYISRGWLEFAHTNEVKEGRRCTFQLLPQADTDTLTMSVEILSDSSSATFEATITASNFKYMNIPIVFLKSTGLKDCKETMLRDPKGRLWQVTINQRTTPTWRAELSGGWRHFAKSNLLKQGDRCIFELVSEGREKYIQVEIIAAQNLDVS